MQIPLLRGRVFTEHERLHNDHYIVVSRQFVDQYFAGDDPIGKHVRTVGMTKWKTTRSSVKLATQSTTSPSRSGDDVFPDPLRHS